MKILISYSVFGRDDKYLIGALKNAEAKRAYDALGDVTQVFVLGNDVPLWVAIGLERRGAEVLQGGPWAEHSILARQTVADLPCDAFFVRDVDSRPGPREALAMAAWLHSSDAFHVMRDHPFHFNPVMAGMWGGVPRMFRDPHPKMIERINAWKEANPIPAVGQHYGYDQALLADVLWPFMKQHGVLQHDSFHRPRFAGAVPFPDGDPTKHFVGAVFDAESRPDSGHAAVREAALLDGAKLCHTCGTLLTTEEPSCKCNDYE
jgi:hypothetical protein